MEHISNTNSASPGNTTTEPLNPSELGTKEYWDSLYERELQNYNDDPEDEGTIWFEESNAEAVVLRELDKLERKGLLRRRRKARIHVLRSDGNNEGNESHHDNSQHAGAPSRLLDLGTGNGHMLFSLLEQDHDDDKEADIDASDGGDDDDDPPYSSWRHNEMVGVDYSPTSIQLARQIASQKGLSTTSLTDRLRFEEWDLLTQPPGPDWLSDGFDIVLDKGTFDAISLMPYQHQREGHPCEVYRSKVTPLLKLGGFLVLTSCNWTREELMGWLAPKRSEGDRGGSENELEYYDEAAYRTFTFGGRKGQSVVTVLFRRRGRGPLDR